MLCYKYFDNLLAARSSCLDLISNKSIPNAISITSFSKGMHDHPAAVTASPSTVKADCRRRTASAFNATEAMTSSTLFFDDSSFTSTSRAS